MTSDRPLALGDPVEVKFAVWQNELPVGEDWRPAVVIGLWRDTSLDVEFPDGTLMALERLQEHRTWRRVSSLSSPLGHGPRGSSRE